MILLATGSLFLLLGALAWAIVTIKPKGVR